MKSKTKSTQSEEFFERLIKEAPFISGDAGELLEGNQIPWLNPKLVKEGQEFVYRHRFAVNMAHIAALLLGFSFKNLTSVLLRTGRFSDIDKAMARHAETEMHILNWYEKDILAVKDEGFKDIQKVRKMHALALKRSLQHPVELFENVPERVKKEKLIEAMKKDLECFATPQSPTELLTYHPKVLMSQFDMAMTQYGFVSLVFLFPTVLGIRDTRGMDGFVHLWAVIGRLIGIQDRFNVALHVDRELYVNIFKIIGMPTLMTSDITATVLQESFATAVSKVMGGSTLKSTLFYALSGAKSILPTFTGENLYKIMDWNDVFHLKITQLIFFLIYHSDVCRIGINKLMKNIVAFNRKKMLKDSDDKFEIIKPTSRLSFSQFT